MKRDIKKKALVTPITSTLMCQIQTVRHVYYIIFRTCCQELFLNAQKLN